MRRNLPQVVNVSTGDHRSATLATSGFSCVLVDALDRLQSTGVQNAATHERREVTGRNLVNQQLLNLVAEQIVVADRLKRFRLHLALVVAESAPADQLTLRVPVDRALSGAGTNRFRITVALIGASTSALSLLSKHVWINPVVALYDWWHWAWRSSSGGK